MIGQSKPAILNEDGELMFVAEDGAEHDIGEGLFYLYCKGCREPIEWELEIDPLDVETPLYVAKCCDYDYNMIPIQVQLCVIDMLGSRRV